ncbi:hypothetical protein [Salininema proteolyticum]|uniref:Uncharacterized protein n=1 Tax=Salininema proteolyticum TaxID=1607685 RepID=A0ABV8U5T4_9ACTN
MEHGNEFKQAMKAMALGESNGPDLVTALPDGSEGPWGIYTAAMFAAILDRVFRDNASPEAVKRFTDGVRYAYRNSTPPVKTLVLEGLIRGMLGEDHLLDEISSEEQYEAELLAIRYVTGTDEHVSLHLENYLVDAETLADSWMEDEG